MNKVYDLIMEDKVPRFLFKDRESEDLFLTSVNWHMRTYENIDLYCLICCYFGAIYKISEDALYFGTDDDRSFLLGEKIAKKIFNVR